MRTKLFNKFLAMNIAWYIHLDDTGGGDKRSS